MQTEKIHFTKEKETMLITLYGKAVESQSKNPILHDSAAEEAIQKIDYDFRNLKMSRNEILATAARAKVFDDWTEEFLAKNPKATVLYLGCGLDSRVFRIDPLESVEWFDVDFPETIELRKHLFPKRANYHMIGSSVTEEEWLDQIPSDRPTLIVAEGLLYYLAEDEVKTLLKRLVSRFSGGQIIFDAASRLYLRMQKTNVGIRATGARMKWGLKNPHELEEWIPEVHLITELSAMDSRMPNLKKLSGIIRFIINILSYIPDLRKMGMMLRYQF